MQLRFEFCFGYQHVKQRLLKGVLVALLCLASTITVIAAQSSSPQILILNSYHKGYVWSDQVTSGIENAIHHTYPHADIFIEYMDTKRNSSASYMSKLIGLYKEKFSQTHFDLIIACDDNAINYMREYSSFAVDIPIVYCGSQNISHDNHPANMATGVKEHFDIKETLEFALTIQPNVNRVVVINDKTVTGQIFSQQAKEIMRSTSLPLEYIQLNDDPITSLEQQVSQLTPDTIVLLLTYALDNQGTYYSPQSTAERLSKASSVPIYSVWDFYFNHGILGGMVTSGYLHGEAAGEMGVNILLGIQPSEIAAQQGGGNRLLVDYRQLQRFNLPATNLPKQALVKNISYDSDSHILMLLSYSFDDKWTRSILAGAKDALSASEKKLKVSTEFMDTKRFNDRAYINDLLLLYQSKYQQQSLDVVLVADDNAFQFAQRYRSILFPGVPIIFCGVNFLNNPEQINAFNITGVTESYDILGTINLGLSLFPETRRLYVINDQTTTGKANSLKLAQVKPQLPSWLTVFETPAISMQQLQATISQLSEDTLILLMSFTTDKNNHKFSYASSIKMLNNSANRPMLGFWDFYAGEGIVAGAITSGYDQGATAGAMVLDILQGKTTQELPVITKSPVKPLIDEAQLKRFNYSQGNLPDNITVINHKVGFFERNKQLLIIGGTLLITLLILVIFQAFKIKLQASFNRRLSVQAVTDSLTHTKTRTFFYSYFKQAIAESVQRQRPLCLCYMDLDALKNINDSYGHKEGDKYILNVVKTIRAHIRSEDELCRIGGDEFVVIFKGCKQSKVCSICELINTDLKKLSAQHQPSYPMGISCGISSLDLNQPQSAEVMLEEADKQMYIAKSKSTTRQGFEPIIN